MIRFIIVAITVIGFLILSIPILLIEWIIGKFSPRTKEISSLRIVQGVFKFILWEAGTKVTIIGEENLPKDTPVLYIGNHRSYFDIVLTYSRCPRSNPAFPSVSSLKVHVTRMQMTWSFFLSTTEASRLLPRQAVRSFQWHLTTP